MTHLGVSMTMMDRMNRVLKFATMFLRICVMYIWMVLTHSHLSMGPTSVYTPKYWTAQQKKDEFLSLPGPWTLLTLLSYHIANVWPNNGKRGSKVCPQCGVYSKPYLDWFMQETTGFTAVAKYRIKPWCFFPVNQFWGEHQNHIQQWKNIQQLDNIQL